ncbi:hypothetical protein FA15DRAFT_169299 [Coprinopsis marcescibilis]|uniref:Uncharacterized protein n=1 Tax=Coprinopsis marcescibilis TaxID=230819 RepID=A0A5C3L4G0_COPMA|nr:hypothetical protein FA15DRAFT_169299 [Coprinopsis marcescibilis]
MVAENIRKGLFLPCMPVSRSSVSSVYGTNRQTIFDFIANLDLATVTRIQSMWKTSVQREIPSPDVAQTSAAFRDYLGCCFYGTTCFRNSGAPGVGVEKTRHPTGSHNIKNQNDILINHVPHGHYLRRYYLRLVFIAKSWFSAVIQSTRSFQSTVIVSTGDLFP